LLEVAVDVHCGYRGMDMVSNNTQAVMLNLA